MPIYQCSAPVGLLTESMKSQIATAITDAHVEATGAPLFSSMSFSTNFLQELRTVLAKLTPKSQGYKGRFALGGLWKSNRN